MNTKAVRILIMLFLFCSGVGAAQQSGTIKVHQENTETAVLEVKWNAVLDTKFLNTTAEKLSEEFPGKIIQVTHPDKSQVLVIKYYSLKIKKEDLLQLVLQKGINNPYYTEQQKKYSLAVDGRIKEDPSKE